MELVVESAYLRRVCHGGSRLCKAQCRALRVHSVLAYGEPSNFTKYCGKYLGENYFDKLDPSDEMEPEVLQVPFTQEKVVHDEVPHTGDGDEGWDKDNDNKPHDNSNSTARMVVAGDGSVIQLGTVGVLKVEGVDADEDGDDEMGSEAEVDEWDENDEYAEQYAMLTGYEAREVGMIDMTDEYGLDSIFCNITREEGLRSLELETKHRQ